MTLAIEMNLMSGSNLEVNRPSQTGKLNQCKVEDVTSLTKIKTWEAKIDKAANALENKKKFLKAAQIITQVLLMSALFAGIVLTACFGPVGVPLVALSLSQSFIGASLFTAEILVYQNLREKIRTEKKNLETLKQQLPNLVEKASEETSVKELLALRLV